MPSQYFNSSPEPKVERSGAVVKPRTLGREVPGSSSNNAVCVITGTDRIGGNYRIGPNFTLIL